MLIYTDFILFFQSSKRFCFKIKYQKMNINSKIVLNNGVEMPLFGLGIKYFQKFILYLKF